MTPEVLEPNFDLLRQEYVLIQAWKKTSSYIRYHNWYADTLELDCATINLPHFIREVGERIECVNQWESDALRIVPAPKSQCWHVAQSGEWKPVGRGGDATPLRPLARVSLRDQVVATAMMLCLANRVESRQGDPTCSIQDSQCRKEMTSYGNRLFCDVDGHELRHRWGSTKLYRSYFQDYQVFIARPSLVAERVRRSHGERVFIIESDLSRFYDRVRPWHLMMALEPMRRHSYEQTFFDFARKVLDWRWDSRDSREVSSYARDNKIEGFDRISLPQGLVSAGFFANAVLLQFDDNLQRIIGGDIAPGVQLWDACRYVDDLRLVVTAHHTAGECKEAVINALQDLLNAKAHHLRLADASKTSIAEVGGSERPVVRQSLRMKRIQSGVSGGFDAVAGSEILDAVRGLMRSQDALGGESAGGGWPFTPVPDVRDETVGRFAAGRFRRTYRSIRPLCEASHIVEAANVDRNGVGQSEHHRAGTRQELDENARTFALILVDRWKEDPANVRLLRIGLDIWPDARSLRAVLALIRPLTEPGGRRKGPRLVAWYCLAELLRAGATETGFVEDSDCLPDGVDVDQYRSVLCEEALRIARLPTSTIPWYLRQQALLFLLVFDANLAPVLSARRHYETTLYRQAILFRRGNATALKNDEFATFAVLSRRALGPTERSVRVTKAGLTSGRKRAIATRDLAFIRELGEGDEHFFDDLPARIREDLCSSATRRMAEGYRSLAEIVLTAVPAENPLRNELAIERFVDALLRALQAPPDIEAITPEQVLLELYDDDGVAGIAGLRIVQGKAKPRGSIYRPPLWCPADNRWRFQVGFLLRFILSGKPDFTGIVRPGIWRDRSAAYRPAVSHWYQRIYGMFSGHAAFGDDWLPITDRVEQLLLALLQWPGCRVPKGLEWVGVANVIAARRKLQQFDFQGKVGSATGTIMLPMVAGRSTAKAENRRLRACIVQTVVPETGDIDQSDLALCNTNIRRKHRNHISAALAAVRRMLTLRATHMQDDGRLDWLILPELAVHPRDVLTHLIPFARAHKVLILTGLTYDEVLPGKPLVNSALWLIPERSASYGLRIRVLRQGKLHLAPKEQAFNVMGFRPCQWLIGYPWSDGCAPLWLTAAVCYDATDLRLAADLRMESDVFVIPAFNKDVKTFDQMAEALHYHMFQLVVIVNNGEYGGSNAYWPSDDRHRRRIFHLHGQPQASIAFFEIDDIPGFLGRGKHGAGKSAPPRMRWKDPPAGWVRD